MPVKIFVALCKCLEAEYPDATCTGGDEYTLLLTSIMLGPRRGLNREPRPAGTSI
jgi:hypothetical protein